MNKFLSLAFIVITGIACAQERSVLKFDPRGYGQQASSDMSVTDSETTVTLSVPISTETAKTGRIKLGSGGVFVQNNESGFAGLIGADDASTSDVLGAFETVQEFIDASETAYTYTAGAGLDLVDNEFSLDTEYTDSLYTYTAGTGLNLASNEFSLNTTYTDNRYYLASGETRDIETTGDVDANNADFGGSLDVAGNSRLYGNADIRLITSATNQIFYPLNVSHVSSGTGTDGFGAGAYFYDDTVGSDFELGTIAFYREDTASGDTAFRVQTYDNFTENDSLVVSADGSAAFAGPISSGGQVVAYSASSPVELSGAGDISFNYEMDENLVFNGTRIEFDGVTADANYTLLNVVDPTATRNILLPDASGTVAVSATSPVTLSSAGDVGFNYSGTYSTYDARYMRENGGTYEGRWTLQDNGAGADILELEADSGIASPFIINNGTVNKFVVDSNFDVDIAEDLTVTGQVGAGTLDVTGAATIGDDLDAKGDRITVSDGANYRVFHGWNASGAYSIWRDSSNNNKILVRGYDDDRQVELSGGGVVLGEQSVTLTGLTAGTQAGIYVKGDKLIVAFNDSGTVRYKYMSLSGTSTTWTHTTTAP